jgi:hypothetical protein
MDNLVGCYPARIFPLDFQMSVAVLSCWRSLSSSDTAIPQYELAHITANMLRIQGGISADSAPKDRGRRGHFMEDIAP